MVKKYECKLCNKRFRSLSGAEWHMNRFHQGDTSRLAKGEGKLSLSEYILIELATELGILERHPDLQYLVRQRARGSIEQLNKNMTKQ